MAIVASTVSTLRIINTNKTCNKTIHLLMEMNNYISEGLINIRALISVILVSVVRELGIMDLVVGSKFYKTTS
jgi:hypothetical protein